MVSCGAPLGYGGAVNDDEDPALALQALKAEHRALDEQIAALCAHGAADQLELARLKKRKLRLKDQIAQIADSNIPDIIA
jgi:hypothetical protein